MNAPGPLYPWLLLNAAAAAWITFSGIHAGHNADSLVLGLTSVYAWTPFYWKQDRFGMFAPLVASGVTDPVSNLVLQVGLLSFAGLCAPLLTFEVFQPSRAGRASVAVANSLLLALGPERIVSNWLYESNYPLALTLACSALLALGNGPLRWWRVAAAAVLSSLACWAYLGVFIWFMPLVVARNWLRVDFTLGSLVRSFSDRKTILELLLGFVGLAATYGLMLYVQAAHPDYISRVITKVEPVNDWPATWMGFASRLDGLPGFWPWAGTCLGLAALGTAARYFRRPDFPVTLLFALLTPPLVETLFHGTQHWPTINEYHPRYILGTMLGVSTALVAWGLAPLEGWLGRRGAILPVGLLVFASATTRYGVPSLDRPRQDLHSASDADDLPLDEIDAVGGDYWTAWPAVFDANARRHAAGHSGMVYGVAERSIVLRPLWERTHPGGMRVAVRDTPSEREKFFAEAADVGLSIPVKVVGRGRYIIYRTRPTDQGP